ncbi:MAG: TIGR03364 family FAD-dependent oxidoreductase [Chitinophagaceae bacterium]|nr:TIGR03364 family FAD-dependent oxidoreductase [Chitinophagaceae bacterium]
MAQRSAIVIGAGIVGLAIARALAIRGYTIKVIDRNEKAVGASIRNFGMIWPIGQPDGKLYERAMLSRQIWKETCDSAGIWYDEAGSLHLAYDNDEWRVLEELQEIYRHRGYRLLNTTDTKQRAPVVVEKNLRGALFSTQELIVDPRKAIERIPFWLEEKYGVRFIWGKAITDICYPAAYSGKEVFEADEIYVCSGADFETLYPELYSSLPITKCKLQMMRMAEQPGNLRIGPALCGGLSLVHYNSFKAAFSLQQLKQRFEQKYPDHLKWGIHVMVSQNETGELTIGDSHEYGLTHDPFDRQFINQLILGYLKKFAVFPKEKITDTWNGIYSKLTNGESHIVLGPEKGVTIINGLGGAGMTLSFGLCEQLIAGKTKSKDITTVSVQ